MRLPRTAAGASIALALLLDRMQHCAFRREPDAPADPGGVAEQERHADCHALISRGGVPVPEQGSRGNRRALHRRRGGRQGRDRRGQPHDPLILAMLPMTLEFSDYGSKEKVATPTGEWDFADAESLDPAAGDLFSYMPWGNLGFFNNTDGNTFSNDLTKIGETKDIDQIKLLDGQHVTIAVAG